MVATTAAAQERSGEKEQRAQGFTNFHKLFIFIVQVQALVDERIEKRLNEKDLVMTEMKSNMHLLWVEVNSETERSNLLLQTVEKLKYEGVDLKLEMKDLKKVEKAVKVELESVRKLVARMQEDSEELERERGNRRVEGVRERLLIMEKVESLSHLYLGGLEEVRADVFNVKFRCRDRVDKLEDQWKEFQQQQQETNAASRDELGSVPRAISTDELAKSAAIWYPKYEAAACIVSELSFKLEQTDKKIRGIYCDENLLQHMAQLSESKGLETVVGSTNWPSLNVKHSKKIPRDETIDSNEHSVRSLNQAVQVLQRRVELLALDHNGVSVAHPELTMDSKFDSKFVGLETCIEHVAFATFSNFQ
ncbi:unnamed protein product [Sphagnum jensenii]|uniref:Uncharacterized protein n=1 Tax=Sphagnum jensenii TaxID=128206 RepID=A0ABP1C3D9_9BRYO